MLLSNEIYHVKDQFLSDILERTLYTSSLLDLVVLSSGMPPPCLQGTIRLRSVYLAGHRSRFLWLNSRLGL